MPANTLGPVGMTAQSMAMGAGTQSMFEGGMRMRAQGMDGKKPGNRIFNISPAVNGKTVWNLDADGMLSLNTTGSWTITPLSTFSVTAKMWGTGGGFPSGGAFGAGSPSAGAGGYAGGAVQLVAGTSYTLRVNQGGGTKCAYGSWGGGYSALLLTSGSVFVLVAGGGGGQGGRNSGLGGAGGRSNDAFQKAQDGATDDQGNGGGQGGFILYPGSGGGANTANLFWANGNSGSGSSGGEGGYSGGGGGGGYFGGGGGSGSDFAGAGGGGGSSYYDPARVTQASLLNGSGGTPGNASDPDRGTAGNPQTSYAVDPAFCGKIVLR